MIPMRRKWKILVKPTPNISITEKFAQIAKFEKNHADVLVFFDNVGHHWRHSSC